MNPVELSVCALLAPTACCPPPESVAAWATAAAGTGDGMIRRREQRLDQHRKLLAFALEQRKLGAADERVRAAQGALAPIAPPALIDIAVVWSRVAPADRANVLRRFWSKVNKSPGCWLWTAGLTTSGYGKVGLKGVTMAAHRFAWFLAHGSSIQALALHGCDNRRCVRVGPGHIFSGDTKTNVHDMISKNRDRIVGEHNFNAKLTSAQVRDIRSRLGPRGSGVALAREFGVTKQLISHIANGRRWRSVTP